MRIGTHRGTPSLTKRIEHDHRGVQQRSDPLRGFAHEAPAFDAVARCCRAFDEQRQYFRLRTTIRQRVPPLLDQRREFHAR